MEKTKNGSTFSEGKVPEKVACLAYLVRQTFLSFVIHLRTNPRPGSFLGKILGNH
jgi:hypothetical protein